MRSSTSLLLAVVVSSCTAARPPDADALTIRMQHADAYEVAECVNDLHAASDRALRALGGVWPPPGGWQGPGPVNASIPWCEARDARTLAVSRLDGDEDLARFFELVARLDVAIDT